MSTKEANKGPRVRIHVQGMTLGLTRDELQEVPPAATPEVAASNEAPRWRAVSSTQPELATPQPLWERAVRALEAMRDIRVRGNGQVKPDANTAPSEKVDQARRKKVSKERI